MVFVRETSNLCGMSDITPKQTVGRPINVKSPPLTISVMNITHLFIVNMYPYFLPILFTWDFFTSFTFFIDCKYK